MAQSFGKFLSEKRKEKKLTQKKLASKLFVSESAVSKWEKDVAHPDITLLPNLSEILGVSEHELITASVDLEKDKQISDANKWNKLTFSCNLFFYIAYSLTILICFIVNLAVDKTLDWFFVVFAALLLSASFTTFPKFIKKNRLFFIPLTCLFCLIILLFVCNVYTSSNWFVIAVLPIICCFFIVFLPIFIKKCSFFEKIKQFNALISLSVDLILMLLFLLVLNNYANGNWFFNLALPLCLIGFFISLFMVFVIKYISLNKGFKTSIILLFWDLAYVLNGKWLTPLLENAGVDMSNFTPLTPFAFDFSNWTGDYISYNVNFIVFVFLLLLSALFLFFGIFKYYKNNCKKDKDL